MPSRAGCRHWVEFAGLATILLAATPAGADPVCPRAWSLADRRGQDSCWVALAAPEAPATRYCVPRRDWAAWLARDPSPCAFTAIRTRASTRRQNELGPHAPASPAPVVTLALIPGSGRPAGLAWRARHAIERSREELASRIVPADALGIVRQLAVGQRTPAGPGSLLLLLGFVHVLTATGIHLYALAAAAAALMRWAGRALGLPVPLALRLSRALFALAWLDAWLLSGARPGMLRPLVLVGARATGQSLGLRWTRASPLAIALLLDLVAALERAATGHADAWAPGRWVYALAVGGGMLAAAPGRRASHVALAWGSWVLVAVFEGLHTSLISPFTPIASLVTLPLFAGLVFPSLLAGQLLIASGASHLASSLLATTTALATAGVAALVELELRLGIGLWVVPRWAWLAGLALGCASWLVPRRRHRLAIGATILSCAVVRAVVVPALEPETPLALRPADQVTQLDVGQGDAALIGWRASAGARAGLVDAGADGALSDAAWIRLLAERGVTRLSFVALTHLDEDHAGGARQLARLLPIRCAASAEAQVRSDRGLRLARELAAAGVPLDAWDAGCVPPVVRVIAPPRAGDEARGLAGAAHLRDNGAMSGVLVRLASGGAWLSAGDADADDEARIARAATAELGAGPRPRLVFKVTHHGSRFSTTEETLRILRPGEAWISSGIGNRYGHPSAPVLERLGRLGIAVRRTDRDGSLEGR